MGIYSSAGVRTQQPSLHIAVCSRESSSREKASYFLLNFDRPAAIFCVEIFSAAQPSENICHRSAGACAFEGIFLEPPTPNSSSCSSSTATAAAVASTIVEIQLSRNVNIRARSRSLTHTHRNTLELLCSGREYKSWRRAGGRGVAKTNYSLFASSFNTKRVCLVTCVRCC